MIVLWSVFGLPFLAGCLAGATVAARSTGHHVFARRGAHSPREHELHGKPSDHDDRDSQRRFDQGFQHHQLNSPANPMKQIDNIPANSSVIAVPLTISGVSASSSFSRSPEIRNKANVNPTPAPNANTTDWINP